MIKKGKVIELEKGSVLHTPMEICSALGFVQSGKLKLSRILSSGKEIFLSEFSTGDIFAELIVFSGEKYPGWLIAAEKTVVVELELNELLESMHDQAFLKDFFTEISQRVSGLRSTIEILSYKTITQKVAYYLLSQKGNTSSLSINVTDLAGRLGCSREALSRTLSQLTTDKIISREKSEISIRNQVLLENLLFSTS